MKNIIHILAVAICLPTELAEAQEVGRFETVITSTYGEPSYRATPNNRMRNLNPATGTKGAISLGSGGGSGGIGYSRAGGGAGGGVVINRPNRYYIVPKGRPGGGGGGVGQSRIGFGGGTGGRIAPRRGDTAQNRSAAVAQTPETGVRPGTAMIQGSNQNGADLAFPEVSITPQEAQPRSAPIQAAQPSKYVAASSVIKEPKLRQPSVYQSSGPRFDERSSMLEYQKQQAIKGNPQSQYALGVRYLSGNGVEKDEKLAREWLEKAAKQGELRAKEKLRNLQRDIAVNSFER